MGTPGDGGGAADRRESCSGSTPRRHALSSTPTAADTRAPPTTSGRGAAVRTCKRQPMTAPAAVGAHRLALRRGSPRAARGAQCGPGTRVGAQLRSTSRSTGRDAAGRAALVALRGTRDAHRARRRVPRGPHAARSAQSRSGARGSSVDASGDRIRLCRPRVRPRRRLVSGGRLRDGCAPAPVRSRCWPATTEGTAPRRRSITADSGGSDVHDHRIDDNIDRELRVVLPLESLVPPVVVPLAAVILVAIQHAEAPPRARRRAGSRARCRHPSRSAHARWSAGRLRNWKKQR